MSCLYLLENKSWLSVPKKAFNWRQGRTRESGDFFAQCWAPAKMRQEKWRIWVVASVRCKSTPSLAVSWCDLKCQNVAKCLKKMLKQTLSSGQNTKDEWLPQARVGLHFISHSLTTVCKPAPCCLCCTNGALVAPTCTENRSTILTFRLLKALRQAFLLPARLTQEMG